MTIFQKRVYKIVGRIPKGKVLAYGEVARLAGRPQAARAIGNLMHRNPFKHVPCHRVIRADGTVGGYAKGTNKKIKLLQQEGVVIKNGRVK